MRKFSDKKAFVCASAGNHAQGVAFMCRQLKVNGIIFMPVTTPQQKIQKTQIFGGEFVEIKLTGDYFDDCLHTAAPSANVFTVSSFVGFPLISASRRHAPPRGSTKVYVQ